METSAEAKNEFIITVMAPDRVGIVAAVAGALFRLGANLTHLSQTVLRGYFTLIISAELPPEVTTEEVRRVVEEAGAPGEFAVGVKPYRPVPPPVPSGNAQRFILTARGLDRPGIIYQISSYLAGKGINIEDFYAYILDHEFVMILQVAIPGEWDARQIQLDIEQLGKEFGLTAHLQHENIFRATSELSAVGRITASNSPTEGGC